MKQVAGVALIAFGMLGGFSTAVLHMRMERAGVPTAERFGQTLGGALCVLTLVVPGFILALSRPQLRTRDGWDDWDEDDRRRR